MNEFGFVLLFGGGKYTRERRKEDEGGGEETTENLKIIEIVFTCNLCFLEKSMQFVVSFFQSLLGKNITLKTNSKYTKLITMTKETEQVSLTQSQE